MTASEEVIQYSHMQVNNLNLSIYLRADWSLPNKPVVWSTLGVLNAGLPPNIPEGLRTNWECFLSRSAGLWCPAPGLMREAPAAPTDWDLGGVTSVLWCEPRSILSDLECLLDADLWPGLFSFPLKKKQSGISGAIEYLQRILLWLLVGRWILHVDTLVSNPSLTMQSYWI